jgi:hypothetical protein
MRLSVVRAALRGGDTDAAARNMLVYFNRPVPSETPVPGDILEDFRSKPESPVLDNVWVAAVRYSVRQGDLRLANEIVQKLDDRASPYDPSVIAKLRQTIKHEVSTQTSTSLPKKQ